MQHKFVSSNIVHPRKRKWSVHYLIISVTASGQTARIIDEFDNLICPTLFLPSSKKDAIDVAKEEIKKHFDDVLNGLNQL